MLSRNGRTRRSGLTCGTVPLIRTSFKSLNYKPHDRRVDYSGVNKSDFLFLTDLSFIRLSEQISAHCLCDDDSKLPISRQACNAHMTTSGGVKARIH